MAVRQTTPGQRTTFAANAVMLLLAACFTAPVIAAPSTDIGCDDVADASLEIAAHDFKAHVVNHDIESKGAEQSEPDSKPGLLAPANYLTPEAAATVREAFQDVARPLAEAAAAGGDDDGDDVEDSPEMKSRLPGVSDSELARYRQQMYRVDI